MPGDDTCSDGTVCDDKTFECKQPPCESDDDCAAGEYCVTDTGECLAGCRDGVEDTSCDVIDPDNCSDGRCACVAHECQVHQCMTDAECAEGQYCDLSAKPHQCLTGCRTAVSGTQEDSCSGDGAPAECAEPGQCRCDEVTRLCVPIVCDENTPCADPCEYCDLETNQCKPGCQSNNCCAGSDEGPYCDLEAHSCAEMPCSTDGDCEAALGSVTFCNQDRGVCENIPCPNGHEDCPATGTDCAEDDEDCVYTYCDSDAELCKIGCRDDDVCPDDQICDPDTHECVEVACPNGHSDCPDGRRCSAGPGEGGICVIGCRSDDVCPSGQPCVEREDGNFMCGCLMDEQCGSLEGDALICSDGVCEEGCTSHSECDESAGEACMLNHRCAVGCPNDLANEPNDDQANPRPLELGEDGCAVLENLMLCDEDGDDDVDWFTLHAEPYDLLQASVTFDRGDGDLKLQVLAGENSLGEASAPSDVLDGEVTIAVNPGAEAIDESTDVLLKVHDSGARTPYSMRVCLSHMVSCTPDSYEPNDSYEAASPLDVTFRDSDVEQDAVCFGEVFGQSDSSLAICGGNEDWFSVAMEEGDSCSVTVQYDERWDTRLNVEFYDAAGGDAVTLGEGANGEATARLDDVSVAGDYKVRVFSPEAGNSAVPVNLQYQLCMDCAHYVEPCDADSFEGLGGNDTIETAYQMPDVGNQMQRLVAENVSLCRFDEDWYSVSVPEGGALLVETVNDTGSEADQLIAVEVWKAGDDAPIAAPSAEAHNSIRLLDIPDAADYFIRVKHAAHEEVAKYYDISIVAAAAGMCIPDTFEDNDTIAEAAPLPVTLLQPEDAEQMVTGLSMCSGDLDYYMVDLTGLLVDELRVGIDFECDEQGRGDLDMYILDEDGNNPCPFNMAGICERDEGCDAQGELAVWSQPPAQKLYIKVEPLEPSHDNFYDLHWKVVEHECTEDPYEVNNSADDAAVAEIEMANDPDDHIYDANLCWNDVDWWKIEVPEDVTGDLRVKIKFFTFEGNLSMAVYDSQMQLLDRQTTNSDDECSLIPGAEAGQYFIRVYAAVNTNPNEPPVHHVDVDYALRVRFGDGVNCEEW